MKVHEFVHKLTALCVNAHCSCVKTQWLCIYFGSRMRSKSPSRNADTHDPQLERARSARPMSKWIVQPRSSVLPLYIFNVLSIPLRDILIVFER